MLKHQLPVLSRALSSYTSSELKSMAKDAGIEGYSKLKKDELIEKLNNI